MPRERREKILKLAQQLAPDFAPIVAEIESKPLTTKDHYGDYVALLSKGDTIATFKTKDPKEAPLVARMFISLCLIKAGGNEAGIRSALAVLHPEASPDLL